MKMKKCLPVIFAALLTGSMLPGCAEQNASSGQNNAAVQNSRAAVNQTAAPVNGTSNEDTAPDASAAYEKLTAYKTADYSGQSVAGFNAALAPTPDELAELLAAQADVIRTISPDDENYDFFTTTMTFSSNELYCRHMGEEVAFSSFVSKQSRPCSYPDDEGNTIYEFNCTVSFQVGYEISSPELITVAERDRILLTFRDEMQNYLNGLSEAEIAGGRFKKMLMDKSAELVSSLSTKSMKLLPCDIYLIEITGEAENAEI